MLRPRPQDVRALLRLAIPIVVVQVGLMLMSTVDTLIVGRVSPAALAAVAIGSLYSMVAIFLGQGILLALDPIVSQAAGARDQRGIATGVQRALVLSLLLTVPLGLFHLFAGQFLTLVRQPAAVVPLAGEYNLLLIPGILPYLVFLVFRQTLQALHRLKTIVLSIVVANIANAFLNWVFIFGHLGMPKLGVAGSAIATSTSRWLMAVMLLGASWRDLKPLLQPWLPGAYSWSSLLPILRLGLPIALQLEMELSCFGAVALLAGAMGTLPVAGHQIAINLAALTYMVPLGVSAAAAVMVGRAVGAGDTTEARRQAATALLVGVGFMATTALAFLLLPRPLALLYTPDFAVVAVAASLIPLAGIFQVFDGTQVVAIGVLRGMADTRAPFVINLLGYWVLGMPIGLLLGYRFRLGVVGLWWGLVIGLAAVAAILIARTRRVLGRPLVRFQMETAPEGRAEAAAIALGSDPSAG